MSECGEEAVKPRCGGGGFRSTFRDWAVERTHCPRDVAEMALAHTIGDKVEGAYRRGDLFEKASPHDHDLVGRCLREGLASRKAGR
jgi:hypothetical protein